MIDILRKSTLQPFFKALADSTRERLVLLLQKYELTVNEVCEILDMGQSRISRHLKILLDANILDYRREGLWSYYSCRKEGIEASCLAALFPFMKNDAIAQDLIKAEKLLVTRSERTRDFFNIIAPRWEEMKKQIFGDLDINSMIIDILRVQDPETIVDLGCGTGDLIDAILGQRDIHSKLIGVDNSPAMIDMASRRFSENAHKPELRIGSIEHLPMRDNEADCALLNCVLHHSPNPASTICEINRALRDNTALILIDFDRHDRQNFASDYGDLWLGFERKTLEKWLYEGGFEVRRYNELRIGDSMALHILISEKVRGLNGYQFTA